MWDGLSLSSYTDEILLNLPVWWLTCWMLFEGVW